MQGTTPACRTTHILPAYTSTYSMVGRLIRIWGTLGCTKIVTDLRFVFRGKSGGHAERSQLQRFILSEEMLHAVGCSAGYSFAHSQLTYEHPGWRRCLVKISNVNLDINLWIVNVYVRVGMIRNWRSTHPKYVIVAFCKFSYIKKQSVLTQNLLIKL